MAKNKSTEDEISLRPEIQQLGERWQKNPKSLVFVPLADAYRKSGLIEEARMVCESGLKYHPTNAGAHVVLAKCYQNEGNMVMARNEFEEANRLDPTNIVALTGLAEIYRQKEMYELAIEKYRQILELDPSNTDAETHLTQLEKQLNASAASSQETAPIEMPAFDDLTPAPAFQENNLAKLYEQQGFHEKALRIYETMAEEEGMSPGLQAKINDLREKTGQTQTHDDDHAGLADLDFNGLDSMSPADDDSTDFGDISLDSPNMSVLDELPEFDDVALDEDSLSEDAFDDLDSVTFDEGSLSEDAFDDLDSVTFEEETIEDGTFDTIQPVSFEEEDSADGMFDALDGLESIPVEADNEMAFPVSDNFEEESGGDAYAGLDLSAVSLDGDLVDTELTAEDSSPTDFSDIFIDRHENVPTEDEDFIPVEAEDSLETNTTDLEDAFVFEAESSDEDDVELDVDVTAIPGVEPVTGETPPPQVSASPGVLARTLVQQLPLWIPPKTLKQITAAQLLDALIETYAEDIELEPWLTAANERLSGDTEPAVTGSTPVSAPDTTDEMLSFMDEEPANESSPVDDAFEFTEDSTPAATSEVPDHFSEEETFELDFGTETDAATAPATESTPVDNAGFEEDTLFDFAPNIPSAQHVPTPEPELVNDDLDLNLDTDKSAAPPESPPEPEASKNESKKKKALYTDHDSFQDWLNGLQKK